MDYEQYQALREQQERLEEALAEVATLLAAGERLRTLLGAQWRDVDRKRRLARPAARKAA
ncbi:MAG: hypothetical protein RB148_12010 [Armatimonadota bacterium]|nr:hypothetical protein [Armatimonadota bacterium]